MKLLSLLFAVVIALDLDDFVKVVGDSNTVVDVVIVVVVIVILIVMTTGNNLNQCPWLQECTGYWQRPMVGGK